ncbi:MAG: hypothetical protein AAF490_25975 [Chloroflexota bacterium]
MTVDPLFWLGRYYIELIMKNKNCKQANNRIYLPPSWCSQICTNAMNEACIQVCSSNRDTSYFELKDALNLEDVPPFPQKAWQSELSNLERKAIAGVYLKLVVDQLKGIQNDPKRIYPESILSLRKQRTKIE